MRHIAKLLTRHGSWLPAVVVAGGFGAWGLLQILGTSAAGAGGFAPSPASGTYQQNSNFTVSISYTNSDKPNDPLAVTFQPKPNLQYVGISFNNSIVDSGHIRTNANGSVTMIVELVDNPKPFAAVLATVTFKAVTAGQASLVLSQGYADYDEDDRDGDVAATQNGNYTIQAPPPPVTTTPTTPSTPKPSTPTKPSTPVTTTPTTPEPPVTTTPTDTEPTVTDDNDDFIADTESSGDSQPATTKKAAAGGSKRIVWIAGAAGAAIAIMAFLVFRRRRATAAQALLDTSVIDRDLAGNGLAAPALTVPTAPFASPLAGPTSYFPGLLALTGVVPPVPVTDSATTEPVFPLPDLAATATVPPPPAGQPTAFTVPLPPPPAQPSQPATLPSLNAETGEPLDMFEMAQLHPESFGRVSAMPLPAPAPVAAAPVPAAPPSSDQAGFIPLLVTVLMLVAAAIYVVYTRVLHASS